MKDILKCYYILYIVCFILQLPSIFLIGIFLFYFTAFNLYQRFYCDYASHYDRDSLSPYIEDKEFQKLFPKTYHCDDASLEGLVLYAIIFFDIQARRQRRK